MKSILKLLSMTIFVIESKHQLGYSFVYIHVHTHHSKSIAFTIIFLFHQILMINIYHEIEFTISKTLQHCWHFTCIFYFKVRFFEIICTIFNLFAFPSSEILSSIFFLGNNFTFYLFDIFFVSFFFTRQMSL